MSRTRRRQLFEAAQYIVNLFHVLLFGIFVLPWLLWT